MSSLAAMGNISGHAGAFFISLDTDALVGCQQASYS